MDDKEKAEARKIRAVLEHILRETYGNDGTTPWGDWCDAARLIGLKIGKMPPDVLG